MWGGSLLTLAIQILGFFIIAVGIYTTLYPLTQKKHKAACLITFVAMGLAVVALSTFQANQASKEQADLRNQIERIRDDNHHDLESVQAHLGDVQARLDTVVAAVASSPKSTSIEKLSEKVKKLAAPNPPVGLQATIQ